MYLDRRVIMGRVSRGDLLPRRAEITRAQGREGECRGGSDAVVLTAAVHG